MFCPSTVQLPLSSFANSRPGSEQLKVFERIMVECDLTHNFSFGEFVFIFIDCAIRMTLNVKNEVPKVVLDSSTAALAPIFPCAVYVLIGETFNKYLQPLFA